METFLTIWLIGIAIMAFLNGVFGDPAKMDEANILLLTAGWPILVMHLAGAVAADFLDWVGRLVTGDRRP